MSSALPPANQMKFHSPANGPVAWLLLGVIVVLGLLVRCHRLDEISYWFDESFCWKMTTFSWGEQWERVALDNHPPLYFYLLKAWVGVLGDSPLATRGLSVVCGVLTIAGGYCLVSELERERRPDSPQGGTIAGLLAAAGLALAPMQIEWSQQLRMYSLGAALTVWSSFALVRALQPSEHPARRWTFYALGGAGLAYTHYYGLFLVAAQGLYCLGSLLFRRRSEQGGPDSWIHAGIAYLAIVMLWSPWAPEFFAHRQQVERSFWTRPLEAQNLASACFQMWGGTWNEWAGNGRAAWTVAWISLVVWLGQFAFGRGQRLLALAPLATFALATGASLAGRNIISPRYFIFAQTLAVCGLAAGIQRIPTSLLKGIAAGVFLLGASWLSFSVVERRDRWASRPGFQSAVAYIDEIRQPGEPIFVANPMIQITAAAYADPDTPVKVLSASSEFPYFQGTAVMRDSDYATPDEVSEWPTDRIWVIDAVNWTGGTSRVTLPRPWVDIRDEAFYDWYQLGSQLVVKECVRSRRSASSDSTE